MINEYMRGALLLSDSKIREQHEEAKEAIRRSSRLVFIGNGGSFQQHMTHDFLKVGNINAISLDSASLLTCLANDCGVENIFAEWIDRIYQENDLLIAVSSSGKSQNIINGIKAFNKLRAIAENNLYQPKIITLTGFERNNLVSQLGQINVWFNTKSYGIHECYSQIFLHSILDDLVVEYDEVQN